MQFNLIGPGRLGKALAASLIHTSKHQLLSVYHPDITTAQEAVDTLRQGSPTCSLHALPNADITLLTCPDDQMPTVIKKLASVAVIKPGSIIMHASGILGSDILMPLKQQGAYIASIHPLKAFRNTTQPDKSAFQGITCAIEGDSNAIKILTPLWQAMGAHIFTLNSEKKAAYHAAAVMASNYLVTLAAEANNLFEASGIPAENAREICVQLMQTSLDNLKQTETPSQALTGPLVRGDVQTIQQHLHAISSAQTKALYCAAGLATLSLTELDNKKINIIKHLLLHKN